MKPRARKPQLRWAVDNGEGEYIGLGRTRGIAQERAGMDDDWQWYYRVGGCRLVRVTVTATPKPRAGAGRRGK